MYTGNLIEELIAAVEHAEQCADERNREEKLTYWYAIAQSEMVQFESSLAGVA